MVNETLVVSSNSFAELHGLSASKQSFTDYSEFIQGCSENSFNEGIQNKCLQNITNKVLASLKGGDYM